MTNSIVDKNLRSGGGEDDCYDESNTIPNNSINSSYTLWGVAPTNCGNAASNIIGSAGPLLPLGNYGGLTQTMPPRSYSRVVNAGQAGACVDTQQIALRTDQRGDGFPRVEAQRCDLGAVETDVFFANGFDAY
ncbi:MAG: choice-of-anchor Q domain-containing protein [Tahibacter sp.]